MFIYNVLFIYRMSVFIPWSIGRPPPSVSAGNHFTFNCEVKDSYCCGKSVFVKDKSTFLLSVFIRAPFK